MFTGGVSLAARQLVGGRRALDFFAVVRDMAHRRMWLLTEALEHAPPAKALIPAQAGEDFVATAADSAGDLPLYWPVSERAGTALHCITGKAIWHPSSALFLLAANRPTGQTRKFAKPIAISSDFFD
jgi:hypothetical protein